uniref:Uncharacterized protein n=1 Tax=Anopheles arabiensis TaxID=7173 RepID=A0A2C9GS78_ANOAR
MTKHPSSRQQR